jgi:RNA-binding protein
MAPARPLTGKQRRHLRALGHHLKPVIHLGKEGLTGGLIAACDAALADHELVKIKLLESVGDDRDTVGAALAEAVSGALAQTLGRTLLIYRARAKDPVIVLPA